MSLCWCGNQDDSVILASHDVWDELATRNSSALQAQLASGRPCLIGKMDTGKTKCTLTSARPEEQSWTEGMQYPKLELALSKVMLIFNCPPEGRLGIQYSCPSRLRSRLFFKKKKWESTLANQESSCSVMSSSSQEFHKICPSTSIMKKEESWHRVGYLILKFLTPTAWCLPCNISKAI